MPGPSVQKAYGLTSPLIAVFPFPVYKKRTPTTNDKNYDPGQVWVYANGDVRTVYIYGGENSSREGVWTLSSTSVGDLSTLEGDSGGEIAATLENIVIAGGTNINTVGTSSPGTITINLATDINVTSAQVGSLNLATNFITSTTSNTNIRLQPNGSGKVTIEYATQHAVPVYGASGALNELGPLTNGQIVIGSTGATPVAAAITSTTTNLAVANGAGSIALTVADEPTFTLADIGNLEIFDNTIAAVNPDGDILLGPSGTGTVNISYATEDAVAIYGASGALLEVGPLTNGQLLIGSTGNAPVGATLTSTGGSVTITNGAGSINLEAVGGGAAFAWSVVTASTASIAANEGIFCNNATSVTVTLPASANVGDTYQVAAMNGTGTFIIDYGTGQSVRVGTSLSTVTTGTLTSTAQGDVIEIVCNVQNTGFLATVKQGNVTIT